VKREILKSPLFQRRLKRWAKRHPQSRAAVEATLEALEADAFQPSLKTHKLQGDLSVYYACSSGYDLRILFEIITYNGAEAVYLLTIGTHDDVYN
jgi:mRNA-degrading endonuclease YafQ of YafQ-DinJ toxin-antitoxin module